MIKEQCFIAWIFVVAFITVSSGQLPNTAQQCKCPAFLKLLRNNNKQWEDIQSKTELLEQKVDNMALKLKEYDQKFEDIDAALSQHNQSINGLINPPSVLGRPCRIDGHCQSAGIYSVCNETCGCLPGYAADDFATTCTRVLGTSCMIDSDCHLDNSVCDGNRTCQCAVGFATLQSNSDPTCHRVLGRRCTFNSDCSDKLNNSVCRNMYSYPYHRSYCNCAPGFTTNNYFAPTACDRAPISTAAPTPSFVTTGAASLPRTSGDVSLQASSEWQSIFSPNYPNYYNNYARITWRINGSHGSHIVLEVMSMNVESGYDYVRIYEVANSIAMLTGVQVSGKRFSSSTNKMVVLFTSDHSVQRSGFHLRYKEILGNESDTASVVARETTASYVTEGEQGVAGETTASYVTEGEQGVVARETTASYVTEGEQGVVAGETTASYATEGEQGGTSASLDIIFVLDGSASVGVRNFNLLKDWVSTVATALAGEYNDTQFGVIQYSYYFSRRDMNDQPFLKTEIPIGWYNMESFQARLNDIRLQGYQTWTAHAINKTVMEFQSSSRYEDNNTEKVMIIVTDGEATDGEDLPSAANYVQSLGIKVFAVGVGRFYDEDMQIMTNGDDSAIFRLNNFEDLPSISESLQEAITEIAN